MKAKKLITDNDLVFNPKGYFGDKIPYYRPCEGIKYTVERGSSNYGVFRAVEYANKKSAEVLDALVTSVYGTDEEKEKAIETLRNLAEEYKQED